MFQKQQRKKPVFYKSVQPGASLDRTENRAEFLWPIHLLVIFTYFYQHQFYCILEVLTLLN